MEMEYFHIRESDYDLLGQLIDLEDELHEGKGGGLNGFELHSYIRYGRVYAAVLNDTVVGCCYYIKDFENPSKVYLYATSIRPGQNTEGLAIDLLVCSLADLKESGTRMVEVTVSPSNYKAQRVYKEELGFSPLNLPADQGSPEEFLILRKVL